MPASHRPNRPPIETPMKRAKSLISFALEPTMRGIAASLMEPRRVPGGPCSSHGTTSPSGNALNVAGRVTRPCSDAIESFTSSAACHANVKGHMMHAT